MPQPFEYPLATHFLKVRLTRPVGEKESLLSNQKVREVLRFVEQHNWRKHVAGA